MLVIIYCRTGFDSDGLTALTIATEDYYSRLVGFHQRPYIPYIGVVLPFMGSLSLHRYDFYFLTILKKTLTFLSL